ncbi:MAG: hypothetical protein J6T15_05025 [Bacilli bacterium]|nr:hypothetical protein [Bacilli bacterium]
MKLGQSILKNLNEIEVHTVDNDPLWAKAVAEVNAQWEKEKPGVAEDIKAEYKEYLKTLKEAGYTKEQIDKMPETKAYKDAIKDPDDIWCECGYYSDDETYYKEYGEFYLGVESEGYLCKKCMKFTQIG